jgi:hypothetical protein
VVAEFLNSMIDCELPIDGLMLLTDFLGITDVSTERAPLNEAQRRDSDKRYNTTTTTTTILEETSSHDIHSLMSVCQGEILRAETHNSMVEQQQRQLRQHQQTDEPFPVDKPVLSMDATPRSTMPLGASQLSSFSHPNEKSDRFHQAVHSALIKVMEERDESHARLVAAEVLFAHELEQQKKKTECAEAELAAVRIAAAADGKMDARRVQHDMQQRHAMNLMQQDSDEELVSLCRQLSVEIGARTASALEVKRLQECRQLEREREDVERAALMEEIERLQQKLALELANKKKADDNKTT